MELNNFPISSRPLEHITFTVYVIQTLLEGNGYFYFAIDAYNGLPTQLGTDKNNQPATILKYIYLLTEKLELINIKDKGFTLILEEGYEDLSERIHNIINGINGKLIVDKAYHNHISLPIFKSLGNFLQQGLNKQNN